MQSECTQTTKALFYSHSGITNLVTAGQPDPHCQQFPQDVSDHLGGGGGTKGVVKMVGGRRLGTSKAAHVFTASILTDLWSELR